MEVNNICDSLEDFKQIKRLWDDTQKPLLFAFDNVGNISSLQIQLKHFSIKYIILKVERCTHDTVKSLNERKTKKEKMKINFIHLKSGIDEKKC